MVIGLADRLLVPDTNADAEQATFRIPNSELRIRVFPGGPLCDVLTTGFATCFRGAESITLDLRDANDGSRLRRLATGADVVIESFRPGTLEGWGLGWDELQPDNPRLVWCSLSSFGSASEVRDRVAHDLNFSSMAGVLDLVGGRGGRAQLPQVKWSSLSRCPGTGNSFMVTMMSY